MPEGVFHGPALVIAGDKSKHTVNSPILNEKLKLRDLYTPYFTDIEIQIIEDAGHFVNADKPKEVTNQIKSFLNR